MYYDIEYLRCGIRTGFLVVPESICLHWLVAGHGTVVKPLVIENLGSSGTFEVSGGGGRQSWSTIGTAVPFLLSDEKKSRDSGEETGLSSNSARSFDW